MVMTVSALFTRIQIFNYYDVDDDDDDNHDDADEDPRHISESARHPRFPITLKYTRKCVFVVYYVDVGSVSIFKYPLHVDIPSSACAHNITN